MPFLPENLLEPISEENPCGEPASVQKNYEKLRDSRRPNEAALEAFMSPRGHGPPRAMSAEIWAPKEANRVIEIIVDMLTLRGKDLEPAVWLAETLLWRNGLGGFLEGLALVRGLLERYWDNLHPLPDEGDDVDICVPMPSDHAEQRALSYSRPCKNSNPLPNPHRVQSIDCSNAGDERLRDHLSLKRVRRRGDVRIGRSRPKWAKPVHWKPKSIQNSPKQFRPGRNPQTFPSRSNKASRLHTCHLAERHKEHSLPTKTHDFTGNVILP